MLCVVWLMCAASAAAAKGARSSAPKAPRHPLTHIPARAGRVDSSFHFPEYPGGKKLPIGPPITVLCHLRNGGKLPINVTHIMGSLNGHRRFYDYIQNFTLLPMKSVLKQDEEMTLSYTFSLSKGLEPEKYEMAHTVFYDREVRVRLHAHVVYFLPQRRRRWYLDPSSSSATVCVCVRCSCAQDRHFANTFFNKTVDTYLAGGHSWDLESVLTVLALLAGTALFAGFASFILFPETAMGMVFGKTAAEGAGAAGAGGAAAGGSDGKGGARAGGDDDEWVKIQPTNTKQRKIKK